MKFVLATHNPNKIREMGAILGQFGVEVVSPRDLGITVDVEETGTTFAENAMLKAKAICELAKLPAIADDSGLCVDALNGGTRRVFRPVRRRGAGRSRPVYPAAAKPPGADHAGRRILPAPLPAPSPTAIPSPRRDRPPAPSPLRLWGRTGFGYDPVFFVPEKAKTFAQLTQEEKAEISHRGKALREFTEKLETYLKK